MELIYEISDETPAELKKMLLGLILREKCINIDGNLICYVVVVRMWHKQHNQWRR
jgi:hypothetical protein